MLTCSNANFEQNERKNMTNEERKRIEDGLKYELALFTKEGSYIYFRTNKSTAKEAYYEFIEKCNDAFINTDNFKPVELVLRNKNYVDIDKINW